MYSRITRRLLSHYVVKSKYRRSLRSSTIGVCCPIFSNIRTLSISSIELSREETTKLECISNDCADAEFDHEGDYPASAPCEEPDEFEEDNNFGSFANISYEAIVNKEPEKIEAIKLILQEMQELRGKGSPFIPTRIPVHRWKMLLECRTRQERQVLLKHLFLMEKRVQAEKRKKAEHRLLYNQTPKPPLVKLTTSSCPRYKLSCNTLFYRQSKTDIISYYNYRLAMAEWFGSSLIIDCGYESYMSMREVHHCCTQLIQSWVENRLKCDPFNIIFCNADENSAVYKYFARLIPTVSTNDNPVNFTKRHYTDLFPVEKLIYLSPHSENVMDQYEPDSVYIIGAFVDETVHDPISMQRAERDGIRTAKFPLDKYLNWCQGSQLLPMNQCVTIMNRLKRGIPWDEALHCVAGRKLNFVGLNFKKDPKVDLKSTRHMWAIYTYEMGKEPNRRAPTDV